MSGLEFLMLAAAVLLAVALLAPLLRAPEAEDRLEVERASFEAEKEALEQDVALGLIDRPSAAAARRELERRFLRAAEAASPQSASSPAGRAVGLVLAIGAPLATLGLYGVLGSPDLPGQPVASREAPSLEIDPETREAIAELERRLESRPDDGLGRIVLARAKRRAGDLEGAAADFALAVETYPDDFALAAEAGEARVAAEGGVVTPEATALFRRALEGDPDAAAPRYFLALARGQKGDMAGAREDLLGLLSADGLPPQARVAIAEEIARLSQALGDDPREALAAVVERGAASDGPGPDAAAIAEAGEMSAEDRGAMIASMVDGLEARLEDDPSDVEGWRRLARAREVQGDLEAADAALAALLEAAPGDLEAMRQRGRLAVRSGPTGPQVTAEAASWFRAVLERAPEDREALWALGRRALDRGDFAVALERWRALDAATPPSDPDKTAIRAQLHALEQRLARDADGGDPRLDDREPARGEAENSG